MPKADAKLRFTFPSDYARVREVQRDIVAALDEHAFDDEGLFAIKLALEEGLINAVKHGNKLDASKSVEVWANVSDERFEVVIHDQGAGFVREAVPDPTLEHNLEKESGRGLMLIEAYMDEVEYTDDGRRLRMMRRNRR